MYWYGDHMSGLGYALGIITMVLFWGLLIVAVVAAIRYLGRSGQERTPPQQPSAEPPPRPTAEQLLAERFARGEIDAGEYQHRLDTLHAPAGPAASR